jgi:hypothetical protein
MFFWLFYGCFFSSTALKAQPYCVVPDSATHTAVSIANYISAQHSAELEKVTCAYHWVVQHLVYDADSMYSFMVGDQDSLLVAATLRRRKGVCENYAGLLTALLREMKITAVVVKGYVKENGRLRRAGHSWVAFQYQQQWWLCDPTWESKTATHFNYWMKRGEELIETHMPFDPIWQLLPNPWSYDDFSRGYRRSDAHIKNWQINDSVKAMLTSNDSAKYSAAYRRIKANGTPNLLVKTWLDYLNMKIAVEFEKQDAHNYQQVVTMINEVSFTFNQYAEWRNGNAYLPLQIRFWKEKMQASLDLLSKAKAQANLIGKAFPNQQYDTGYMLERIQLLLDKCKVAAGWVATLKVP